MEAAVVWQAMNFFRDDIALNGNIIGIPNDHRIILLIACSTAYGLPKAILGLMAISLFLGMPKSGSLYPAILAMACFYAFANLVRLCVMTWSDAAFHLAHGPIGANIFDAAITTIVFLTAIMFTQRQ